jgi:hypothetical protein
MLNSKYKPMIIGIATLGALDAIGVLTVIVNPDLIARIISALAAIQIAGLVVVGIIYMIRAQSQNGTEILPGVSTDSSAESVIAKRSKWSRMRWGWFAIAALGILQTPTAIIHAIQFANSYHRLAPVMVLAFAIRIAMIWFFLRLWWQFRPTNH